MEIERFYVVPMGDSFEEAKATHKNSFFTSVKDAVEWGKLLLPPGKKFWVCDQNGGVREISQVPPYEGNA